MRISYATARLHGMPQRLMELWTYCDRWICRHDRASDWTFGILYKLSLDAMYIWAASPAFSYGGLIYAPNGLKYLLSNLLYLLVLAYLPRQEKNIAPIICFYLYYNGLIERSFSLNNSISTFDSNRSHLWVVRN